MKQPRKRKRSTSRLPTRFNEYQIRYIFNKIFNNEFPSVDSLARELGVSDKCILRNISHMKTHRKHPIAVSRKHGREGYYFDEPVSECMKEPLTREQLMYWLIAHDSMAQLPGVPREILPGADALSELIDPSMMTLLKEMQDMFYFKPFAPEPVDMSRVFQLTDARHRRRVTLMKYKKHMADKPDDKRVAPLGLALINGTWYMVVLDIEKNKYRTYMLSRMSDIEITNEKFKIPADFCIKKHFEHAFIVLGGDEEHKVDVEFDAWAAPYIRGRKFMPDQTMEELPNGGLRLKFTVGALEEVAAWVCWWRQHARVHGSPDLINHMRVYRDYLNTTLD